ncbi:hypothetical protein ECH_0718 [Ehrlichia chaffeensis str. Arkansas]|uniref:Uncharacterized protein n=1 Tax=Ehrlichia chaffeensis (strain ATCC CRL-10679 / Arkansas) TaxID=205920 RepID=Q2GGB2_EHRCR|nr:hypothetical protein ECH_0718 [Ehrlichia chaffeensis str. Arkansas]
MLVIFSASIFLLLIVCIVSMIRKKWIDYNFCTA